MKALKSPYVQLLLTLCPSNAADISISTNSLIQNAQADKIIALADAADVELEPIWAALLAKALEGRNVKELLLNVGSGGGGPAPGVVTGGATGAGPAVEAEKEEEKKEEEKEESDEDMVCHLLYSQQFPPD